MPNPQAIAETTDLGVVDPIRIPGGAAAARWWRRTPALGRLFLGLAVLDILVRVLGVVGPPIVLDAAQPLTVLALIVPRFLWIALPAIVLTRRPDAETSIPWIFRGAVLIALTTLVIGPLSGLVGLLTQDVSPILFVPGMLNSLLLAAAWLLVGRGFDALRPRPATPLGARLSIGVAIAFVASAVLELAALARGPGNGVGGLDWLIQLANALTILVTLATGYALWVIARGADDELRPARASRLGLVAVCVWATAAVVSSVATLAFLIAQPAPDDLGNQPYAVVFGMMAWLTSIIAPVMLIAAIAIGLVDPDLDSPHDEIP